MEQRTVGIIATVATVLLCGLPGLCICVFGILIAAGIMPYTTELNGITDTGTVPPAWGYGALCLALILILIPVVVGLVTLRKRPAAAPVSNYPDEPIPPAS